MDLKLTRDQVSCCHKVLQRHLKILSSSMFVCFLKIVIPECVYFVSGEEAGKALSLCIDMQCIICHIAGKDDHQVRHLCFHNYKCIIKKNK